MTDRQQTTAAAWDRHAESYDLIYGPTEERRIGEELPFFEWAFAELATREVREVLDLTAGTGLQAVALAARGLDVTAADLSEGMLARCRERAAARGVSLASTVCRPAQETDDVERFDACISSFASLNTLLEDDDLSRTLAAAHRALRPGGLLVFDMMNLLDAVGGDFFPEVERSGERDGVPFTSTMTNRFDSWRGLLFTTERTELGTGTGRKVVDVDLTFRAWTRGEVERLLDKLPWARTRTYRGYNDRGESDDSRVFRMVFTATR